MMRYPNLKRQKLNVLDIRESLTGGVYVKFLDIISFDFAISTSDE